MDLPRELFYDILDRLDSVSLRQCEIAFQKCSSVVEYINRLRWRKTGILRPKDALTEASNLSGFQPRFVRRLMILRDDVKKDCQESMDLKDVIKRFPNLKCLRVCFDWLPSSECLEILEERSCSLQLRLTSDSLTSQILASQNLNRLVFVTFLDPTIPVWQLEENMKLVRVILSQAKHLRSLWLSFSWEHCQQHRDRSNAWIDPGQYGRPFGALRKLRFDTASFDEPIAKAIIRSINLAEVELLDIKSYSTFNDPFELLMSRIDLAKLKELRLIAGYMAGTNRLSFVTSLVHRTHSLTSLKLSTIDLGVNQFELLVRGIGKQLRQLMLSTYQVSCSDAEMLRRTCSRLSALYIGVYHCQGDRDEIRAYEALSKIPKLNQLRIQVWPKIERGGSVAVQWQRLFINSAMDLSLAEEIASIFQQSTNLESLSLRYMPENIRAFENLDDLPELMRCIAGHLVDGFKGQYCFKRTGKLLSLLPEHILRSTESCGCLRDAQNRAIAKTIWPFDNWECWLTAWCSISLFEERRLALDATSKYRDRLAHRLRHVQRIEAEHYDRIQRIAAGGQSIWDLGKLPASCACSIQ